MRNHYLPPLVKRLGSVACLSFLIASCSPSGTPPEVTASSMEEAGEMCKQRLLEKLPLIREAQRTQTYDEAPPSKYFWALNSEWETVLITRPICTWRRNKKFPSYYGMAGYFEYVVIPADMSEPSEVKRIWMSDVSYTWKQPDKN